LWWVLKQRVHTFTLRWLPLRLRVCLWMLGMNRVLVRRLEWLTLLPDMPIFPQISHFMLGNPV
jgi:hypothetical protein